MRRRFGQVLTLAVVIVGLPALGNPEVLASPKVYVVILIAALATAYQPSYSPVEAGPATDRATALQIVWSIYLVMLAAVLEAFYPRYPESLAWTPVVWGALTVALFGLFLRSWAFRVLGEYFTWHVKTLPEHRVIEDGPYRFVRHPSYTGAFLTYAALPLFLGARVTFLASLVILTAAFVRRIRVEEQALVAKFGEAYEDYRRRTGGLVPWIG